jgi:hypothetical protein
MDSFDTTVLMIPVVVVVVTIAILIYHIFKK